MKKKFSSLFPEFTFSLLLLLLFSSGCENRNTNSETLASDSTSTINRNNFPASLDLFRSRLVEHFNSGDTIPVKPGFMKSCFPSSWPGYEMTGEDSLYSFSAELKLSEYFRRFTSKNETSIDIRITDLLSKKNLVESEINLFNSGQNEFEESEQQFPAPPDSFTIMWTWQNPSEFISGLSAIVDFRFRISIVAEGNGTEKTAR